MKLPIDGYSWIRRIDFEKATGQSLRHLFFHRGDQLVREGIARKWGKTWMVRPDRLDAFIEKGGTAEIAR